MSAQKNVPKNEEEEKNCCFRINFSSKQWASVRSVQKNILYS